MTSPVRTSETTAQLDEALAAAQVELENPAKTKTAKVSGTSKNSGKDFEMTYAYADIADLLSACRPVLASHGVAIIQIPRMTDNMGAVLLTTRLAFKGEWIEGDYPVCNTGVAHQEMGKAMTYARRYALGAMIGVAPEKDDDGQGAAHTPSQRPVQNQPRPTNVRPSAPAQVALTAINTATSRADLKAWSDLHRDALVDLISAEEYDQIGVVFKRRWSALPPIPKDEPKPPEPEPEPEPSADELFPGDEPPPVQGDYDPATGEISE